MRAAAVVVLVAVGVLLGGCRSLTGRPFGQWADDHAITSAVKQRLAHASPPRVHVNVDTYGGVVYLSGAVDREGRRAELEALAEAVPGVVQVVTNLMVTPPARGSVRAAADKADGAASVSEHPLLARLPHLARIVPADVPAPTTPALAYDQDGRVVATIYAVTMRDLGAHGVDDLRPAGGPVDHVAIYAMTPQPDVPEPIYYVVLWHVSRAQAGRFR